MPTFAFSGRTRSGETVTGERVGDTIDAVVAMLRREQVLVTKVSPVKAKADAAPKKGKLGKSASPKSLAIFTRQFSVMIDAGLPLVQCLEILGSQDPDAELRRHNPAGPRRRRERPVAGRRDAEAPEGLRRPVHQHGGGGRSGRHPRHHPQAPGDLHREGRQAEEPGQVGDGVPGRGHRDRRRGRRRRSSGRSSRLSPGCSRHSARSCRCRRASSSS